MAKRSILDRNGRTEPDGELPAGTVLGGGFVSVIQNSDYVLAELGLADDRGVLIVGTSDLDEALSGQSELKVTFTDQFVAFIGISAQQCGNLPTVREWFEPAPHYIQVMRELRNCGYAHEQSGKFLWLDSVELPMRKAYIWNKDGENLSTVWEAESVARSVSLLQTMPYNAQRALTHPSVLANALTFKQVLAAYWNFEAKEWRTEPVEPSWVQLCHFGDIEPVLQKALREKATDQW